MILIRINNYNCREMLLVTDVIFLVIYNIGSCYKFGKTKFVDDLAVLAVAWSTADTEILVSRTLSAINDWISGHDF